MKNLLLDLVYPRICASCGNPAGRDAAGHICWECRSGLMVITDPYCSICGDPVDGKVYYEYKCSWCVDRTPFFDSARSAVRYRGKMRDMMQSYKYNKSTHLTEDFAGMLHACVDTHYRGYDFDAIAYVPMESWKQRKRTYNQSELMAVRLAGRLGLQLASGCLKRINTVASQTAANAAVRAKNVRNAFEVAKGDWVYGRRFLLVDDIMTTGATVNECSRTLKNAGAVTVHVVTVARG